MGKLKWVTKNISFSRARTPLSSLKPAAFRQLFVLGWHWKGDGRRECVGQKCQWTNPRRLSRRRFLACNILPNIVDFRGFESCIILIIRGGHYVIIYDMIKQYYLNNDLIDVPLYFYDIDNSSNDNTSKLFTICSILINLANWTERSICIWCLIYDKKKSL